MSNHRDQGWKDSILVPDYIFEQFIICFGQRDSQTGQDFHDGSDGNLYGMFIFGLHGGGLAVHSN